MYPSDHPTTAMVLARYRMQEDIARAEAYRAARAAHAAAHPRGGASRMLRATRRARGGGLIAALRAVLS